MRIHNGDSHPHPRHRGVVWDATAKQFKPQPIPAELVDKPEAQRAWLEAHPEVLAAQMAFGQNPEANAKKQEEWTAATEELPPLAADPSEKEGQEQQEQA